MAVVAPLELRVVATCSHAHKSTAAAAAEERGIIIIVFVWTGSDPSLGTGSLGAGRGDPHQACRVESKGLLAPSTFNI